MIERCCEGVHSPPTLEKSENYFRSFGIPCILTRSVKFSLQLASLKYFKLSLPGPISFITHSVIFVILTRVEPYGERLGVVSEENRAGENFENTM